MANKKRTKKETSNKAINTEEILEQMKEVSFNTIVETENKTEEVTNTKDNNFDSSNVNEETVIDKNETEETVNDKKNVIEETECKEEETECKEEKTDVNENTEIHESTNESVVDEQMEKLFEDMDKIKDSEKVETTSKKEQKKIRKTTRDVFGYNWRGKCYDF